MKTTRIALAAIAALWAHGCDDSGPQPGPGSTDAASMADVVRPDDGSASHAERRVTRDALVGAS